MFEKAAGRVCHPIRSVEQLPLLLFDTYAAFVYLGYSWSTYFGDKEADLVPKYVSQPISSSVFAIVFCSDHA